MAPVMAWSERALVGTGRQGDATPSRLTTLYDLITTLQEVAEADDALVVGTIVHLLHSGRLTRCGPTQAVGPVAACGEVTKEAALPHAAAARCWSTSAREEPAAARPTA